MRKNSKLFTPCRPKRCLKSTKRIYFYSKYTLYKYIHIISSFLRTNLYIMGNPCIFLLYISRICVDPTAVWVLWFVGWCNYVVNCILAKPISVSLTFSMACKASGRQLIVLHTHNGQKPRGKRVAKWRPERMEPERRTDQECQWRIVKYTSKMKIQAKWKKWTCP